MGWEAVAFVGPIGWGGGERGRWSGRYRDGIQMALVCGEGFQSALIEEDPGWGVRQLHRAPGVHRGSRTARMWALANAVHVDSVTRGRRGSRSSRRKPQGSGRSLEGSETEGGHAQTREASPRTQGRKQVPVGSGMVGVGERVMAAVDSSRVVKVVEMLQGFGLSIEDCAKVINRRPGILSIDLVQDVERAMKFLHAPPLSMTTKQVARVMRDGPQIFEIRDSSVMESRLQYLTNEVGLGEDVLASTVAKRPRLLWLSLPIARANVEWLVKTVGLRREDLGGVVTQVPQVLILSTDALQTNVDWLRETIGFSREKSAKFITRYPQIFSFKVETTLEARRQYFASLGLDAAAIRRILQETPSVLEESIDHCLKKKVAVLENWGLDTKEDIAKVFSNASGIFNVEISEHMRWLESLGLGKEQVCDVIRNYPQVLLHSIPTNLAPKWDILSSNLGLTISEIVEYPQCFQYSLERRIFPRIAVSMNLDLVGKLNWKTIVGGTDKEFCDVAGLEIDYYRDFLRSDALSLLRAPLV
eukprot:CAMPEP_0184677832 /NCGR_PEP_ID=MMETSP0312-20130426/415_1 /TAXON_ID=31354 /ORGANISM="Compsopogon coeruleus, Strain SAG 36.94" /LENGTH=529 /DNA_ID=CAMNT_0027125975 /DNA_START=159 /DNA_END=1748 /DNA_ORIENTATION=+